MENHDVTRHDAGYYGVLHKLGQGPNIKQSHSDNLRLTARTKSRAFKHPLTARAGEAVIRPIKKNRSSTKGGKRPACTGGLKTQEQLGAAESKSISEANPDQIPPIPI